MYNKLKLIIPLLLFSVTIYAHQIIGKNNRGMVK